MQQVERLVMMANQIAQAFAYQGNAKAASSVADHLRKFWDPRMRAAIRAHVANGGEGLLPNARAAVELLAGEAASRGTAG
ncbi:MAG TPA: formate dehydrogenase subunit delta [Acidisphaera sp.]|nr:formate dehydrogenase subunit delta [Acidisphaera sp.]